MSVFRVHRNENYVTMSKYHLKEKEMSLKAIGLLSLMLSLPDDWDYSINGLKAIRCESKNTINGILKELEEFGYLVRTQLRDDSGKMAGYQYDIYEEPQTKKPYLEKPYLKNRDLDNCTQLNNNKLNNKQLNNNINNIYSDKKSKKPTIEEIKAYCEERNNNIDAETFYDFYEANGWVQGKNKPIKDWKACVRTWERKNNKKGGWVDDIDWSKM